MPGRDINRIAGALAVLLNELACDCGSHRPGSAPGPARPGLALPAPDLGRPAPPPPGVPPFNWQDRISYSLTEIASLTGVSVTALRKAIDSGELRAARIGRRKLLITAVDAEAWLNTAADRHEP